jgi:signal transduction histidine kinase
MLPPLNMRARAGVLLFPLLFVMAVGGASAQDATPMPLVRAWGAVTNLLGLAQLIDQNERIVGDVNLEGTVCAATDPTIGAIILQDTTDVALIELGPDQPAVLAGEKIRIEGKNCLLRRRDMGVKISAVPVVDNDGVHVATNMPGQIRLTAGRYPLRLEWFNQLRDFSLSVTWQRPDANPEMIPAAALWHQVSADASGKGVFEPGLQVDCYEGNWLSVPDFELLKAAKSGVTTNFELGFRTRNPFVGLRFKGFFDAPQDGLYTFRTKSDDGSLLFIGDSPVTVTKLESGNVPQATPAIIGEAMASTAGQRWVSVEGRINFVSPSGKGLELKLRSERDSIRVRIADATGLDATRLMNQRVRVTGAGCGIFNLDRRIVLGDLFAANGKALEYLDPVAGGPEWTSPLVSARQVQSLPLEDASRALPVHLRGVITSKGPPYDRWVSIQDDTRGIFIDLHSISNGIPASGDFCEIAGHSGKGDFAPIVVADEIHRLGKGDLPEPARPAWNELINGSMDVQWVEFQGLVTDVRSNTLSMLLPGGQLDVQVDQFEASLTPFEKSVVRIQGVLFAAYATSREVRVGNVVMRNASISVDIPVPSDPFEAVLKTPRDLLLFDAQATAFRRVKVRGQIVHAEGNQIFLMDEGSGIRLLSAESAPIHAGDLVDAVGYPDISGSALLLREAKIRKTGHASLPEPKTLTEAEMTREEIDATRVRVEGKLLGLHLEQRVPVLEMQSGAHLYLARLPQGESRQSSLRPGSKLALKGVYVGHGHNQHPGAEAESFELLLNSFGDLVVLSQPPWWTLQRLLIIVGLLLVGLTFAVVWISQLRRVVDQRTSQLQREIRERERVERQHALEAERSRIARDLHDDLGSSLTEINALASTGQRPQADEANQVNLFHAIAGKARSLIAALDVIVWAVDPEDNLLQSLADYLSGYAEEFFSNTNISCRFKVPVSFPEINLEGRVRHDLLMTVKEALNNVVRHAEATEVEFRMAVTIGDLEIEIADNGKGFEGSSEKGGHGLKNLSARLLKLGGSCTVESRVAGGTVVRIRLPLSQPSPMSLAGSAQKYDV